MVSWLLQLNMRDDLLLLKEHQLTTSGWVLITTGWFHDNFTMTEDYSRMLPGQLLDDCELLQDDSMTTLEQVWITPGWFHESFRMSVAYDRMTSWQLQRERELLLDNSRKHFDGCWQLMNYLLLSEGFNTHWRFYDMRTFYSHIFSNPGPIKYFRSTNLLLNKYSEVHDLCTIL